MAFSASSSIVPRQSRGGNVDEWALGRTCRSMLALSFAKFSGHIFADELDVAAAEPAEVLVLLLAHGADDLGGDADDQRAVGDFHAGGDDGAGGDEAFCANVGVAEQDRAHADEGAAADALAVDDR